MCLDHKSPFSNVHWNIEIYHIAVEQCLNMDFFSDFSSLANFDGGTKSALLCKLAAFCCAAHLISLTVEA